MHQLENLQAMTLEARRRSCAANSRLTFDNTVGPFCREHPGPAPHSPPFLSVRATGNGSHGDAGHHFKETVGGPPTGVGASRGPRCARCAAFGGSVKKRRPFLGRRIL